MTPADRKKLADEQIATHFAGIRTLLKEAETPASPMARSYYLGRIAEHISDIYRLEGAIEAYLEKEIDAHGAPMSIANLCKIWAAARAAGIEDEEDEDEDIFLGPLADYCPDAEFMRGVPSKDLTATEVLMREKEGKESKRTKSQTPLAQWTEKRLVHGALKISELNARVLEAGEEANKCGFRPEQEFRYDGYTISEIMEEIKRRRGDNEAISVAHVANAIKYGFADAKHWLQDDGKESEPGVWSAEPAKKPKPETTSAPMMTDEQVEDAIVGKAIQEVYRKDGTFRIFFSDGKNPKRGSGGWIGVTDTFVFYCAAACEPIKRLHDIGEETK